jgi:hypothetical protein
MSMSIGASLGDILSGQEVGSLGGILEYDGALLQRLGLHEEQPHHRLLLENNHTVHRMQILRLIKNILTVASSCTWVKPFEADRPPDSGKILHIC